MINMQGDMIEKVVAELQQAYFETYGEVAREYGNILGWITRLSLENIANTDALYHNMEHTLMVALVGQEILRGKHLREGGVKPAEWLQFMVACLCHDIGYVRGVCRKDEIGLYDNGFGELVQVPATGTDAALTPYHVDRSKLFVRERFSDRTLEGFDLTPICEYIEMTRFNPDDMTEDEDIYGYPALTRAADFIGQLGDPGYLRKIPALFYEFQELGVNEKMGYANPEAMRDAYARFFWQVVNSHIQGALHYLNISQRGKQWVASLYAHVFRVEHKVSTQTVRPPSGVIFE